MAELRECPFCGSKEVKLNAYRVICRECECEGPIASNPINAREFWNYRNPEKEDNG